MKLSQKTLEGLKTTGARYTVWDDPGDGVRLGVRVSANGRKTYVLDYRGPDGARKRMTLGPCESMPPTEARKVARSKMADVVRGDDPLEQRRRARKEGLTVAELWARYLREYVNHPHPPRRKGQRPLSERTRVEYRWQWEKRLKPVFGDKRVRAVDQASVERFHRRLGVEAPTLANRCLALLGGLFTFAEHDGVIPRGSNPCRGVIRFEEKGCERFLSTVELQKLGEALRDVEDTQPWQAVAAVRLLLLTGARKNEVLHMRWEDVDLERRLWNIPQAKTGPRSVFLNGPAADVLASLPREEASPWVLPGRDPSKPFVGLPKVWGHIRQAAGLTNVRLHDLRHSVASVGRAAGLPLGILQGLLGHREASTTQRYSHLGADPVRDGAETVGRVIEAALNGSGSKTDNVVKHPAAGKGAGGERPGR